MPFFLNLFIKISVWVSLRYYINFRIPMSSNRLLKEHWNRIDFARFTRTKKHKGQGGPKSKCREMMHFSTRITIKCQVVSFKINPFVLTQLETWWMQSMTFIGYLIMLTTQIKNYIQDTRNNCIRHKSTLLAPHRDHFTIAIFLPVICPSPEY